MQRIHEWTAAFDYEDLDKVIAAMKRCNAFRMLIRPVEAFAAIAAGARGRAPQQLMQAIFFC